jgi:hypothetical protein
MNLSYKYWKGIIRDKLVDIWDSRFLYGVAVNGFMFDVNRYINKHMRFGLAVGMVASPGTGHWPWAVLDIVLVTGERGCWHVGILGFHIGTVWLRDANEDGTINGPDKKKLYTFISCINHRNQSLEEII